MTERHKSLSNYYDTKMVEISNLKENMADKIINAFTVKRRKALIDIDPDTDLVDREESEYRIYLGLKMIGQVSHQ